MDIAVEVEEISSIETKLVIDIPPDEIDSAVKNKLIETAKTAKVDGFRPGKVPVKEIGRRYGDSIRLEVISDFIDKSYSQALRKKNIQPTAPPKIEILHNKSGENFQFKAYVEVIPNIKLKSLESIEVIKPVTEVTEQDLKQMQEKIRQERAQWETKEGTVENGDLVVIDFEGTIDGASFTGGKGENQRVEIGSGQLVGTFEEQLIGQKIGDECAVNITFPEDYNEKTLQNKAADFAVTIKEVKSKHLPEINEEFIQSFGIKSGSFEEFKQEIKENMQKELKKSIKTHLKNQVLEGLLVHNPLEVPLSLVEREADRQRQQALQQLGDSTQQKQFESLLTREYFKEQSEKSVKLALLLSEYIKQHEIKAEDERVNEVIEEMTSEYSDTEGMKNWLHSNQEELQHIKSLVVEDIAVEKILEHDAVVTEKKLAYQQVIEGKLKDSDQDNIPNDSGHQT